LVGVSNKMSRPVEGKSSIFLLHRIIIAPTHIWLFIQHIHDSQVCNVDVCQGAAAMTSIYVESGSMLAENARPCLLVIGTPREGVDLLAIRSSGFCLDLVLFLTSIVPLRRPCKIDSFIG